MSIMANAFAQAGLVPQEKAEKISNQIESRKYHLRKNRERYDFLEKKLPGAVGVKRVEIETEMKKLRGFIE